MLEWALRDEELICKEAAVRAQAQLYLSILYMREAVTVANCADLPCAGVHALYLKEMLFPQAYS